MTAQDRLVEAFTKMAPSYEEVVDRELTTFWGWRYDLFLDAMLEETHIAENDRVLDLATGTAAIPLKLSLNGHSGRPIIGLDITLAMLQIAQQKVAARGTSIYLTCASATDIPFVAETFDVILCGLASHHIPASALLPEMRRVLKTGGRITIADVVISPILKKALAKQLLRMATFVYFLDRGYARAASEAAAITYVLTVQEWYSLLKDSKFGFIQIERLPIRNRWIPAPFIITARAE